MEGDGFMEVTVIEVTSTNLGASGMVFSNKATKVIDLGESL